MNKITTPTFKAEITIGLNKGFSDEIWNLDKLKTSLQNAQKLLKNDTGVLLSAKVTLCDIVFLGQDEPSVTISFINYPKFSVKKEPFKHGVVFIAKKLMNELEQNRIVIVFNDETIMFEIDDKIDGSISL